MIYFSGFCLSNESELFKTWLNKSNYTVAGFSYGAIKAIEYALNSKTRIDRLQLFSPAFFNNKDKKFKKLQLLYFAKDKNAYIDNFLKNVSDNSSIDLKNYFKEGTKEQLEELLNYNWQKEKLEALLKKGVVIEVFLGESDKIIDSKEALDFFKSLTTTYFIKNANHLLKAKE
jgi:hypothetical protein